MTLVLRRRLILYSDVNRVFDRSDLKNVRNLSDMQLESIVEFISLQKRKSVELILGDANDPSCCDSEHTVCRTVSALLSVKQIIFTQIHNKFSDECLNMIFSSSMQLGVKFYQYQLHKHATRASKHFFLELMQKYLDDCVATGKANTFKMNAWVSHSLLNSLKNALHSSNCRIQTMAISTGQNQRSGHHNDFESELFSTLIDALPFNFGLCLKKLKIGMVSVIQCQRLLHSLIANRVKLQRLELLYCLDNNLRNLSQFLACDWCTLSSLHISIPPWVTKKGLTKFASTIEKSNTSLRSLRVYSGRSRSITGALCRLVTNNRCLTDLQLSKCFDVKPQLLESLNSKNFTLQNIIIGSNSGDILLLKQCDYILYRIGQRNQLITWKNVHAALLNFCIAFASLRLPPYVLLEIFDWLPYMHLPTHSGKITFIMKFNYFYRRLRNIEE